MGAPAELGEGDVRSVPGRGCGAGEERAEAARWREPGRSRATAGIRVSRSHMLKVTAAPAAGPGAKTASPRLFPGALGSPFPGLRFRNPLQDQGKWSTSLIDFPLGWSGLN